MYLVNIVFGEIFCNLDCSYCAYPKKAIKKFTIKDKNKLNDNLNLLKNLLDKKFPKFQVISLTGGEPLLFPQVIQAFQEKFPQKWIRVSTNGILIRNLKISKNSKIYFAVSLDGRSLETNRPRFSSEKTLKTILENITYLLKRGGNIEILTTLNHSNIDDYFEFLRFLENKYHDYILDKKLWVLPSPIVIYSDHNLDLKQKQIKQFQRNLTNNNELFLVKSQSVYYQDLARFLSRKETKNRCDMYRWALSLKYLGDSLWEQGTFLLYGCGCRGIKVLGQMDLNLKFEEEMIVKRFNSKILKKYFKQCNICQKGCYNNWRYYDIFFKDEANDLIFLKEKNEK